MNPRNHESGNDRLGGRRYDTGPLKSSGGQGGLTSVPHEPVAVIGMAGYFPGARSLEEFCARLERQDSFFITPPANHMAAAAVKDRYGAFLDDVSQFDPDPFRINTLEAEYLDPRQRLLLMSAWHTLEDACYLPDTLARARTDVYIASEGCPYAPFVHAAEVTPYSPTGPSSSSLPNRLSQVFKFGGKSLFVDTACSGSLTAVQQAMQALRRHEADYVLVGGVNLLFGVEISLSFLGQQSLGIVGDAQACHPFQNSAKGFQPAEGVVTVLLKRLSDAVRDHDNIHAVLLGAHVNHVGGTGASLTMPSAKAQADAILAAYADAQIPPWTVTYIEAHGASSILADAAEIQAFTLADRTLRESAGGDSPWRCKISTIKPNIGHANCVSGLMSLVRLVHCLRRRQKLGVKNFTGLSDRISLEGTRFYISEQSEPWELLIDDAGNPIPRRAAINNFGAGGVNVHLLVEEFVRPDTAAAEPGPSSGAPFFLALSSLRPDQLLAQASELAAFLRADPVPEADLEALFLTSRTALPCRLVFRYRTINELIEKLEKYETSSGARGYHFRRDTREANESLELFSRHPKLSGFVSSLGDSSDKGILFELWSLGLEEPVRKFFDGSDVNKRSLPRYPFNLRSFWVKPKSAAADSSVQRLRSFEISPLLQHNTSDLSAQQYTSVFTGEEFFLGQHVVKGFPVLPGVAYLEMARAAVAQATNADGTSGIRIQNIVWARPIVVDVGPKTIHTRLRRGDQGRIDFEIFSDSGMDSLQRVLHCQGSAILVASSEAPRLDIEAVARECQTLTIGPEACYRAFRSLGIEHGAAFQGVEEIHGAAGQVLAKIRLPEAVAGTQADYVLHPSTMDAALQSLLGLVSEPTKATLPFALQALEIFAPCPIEGWAYVRHSPGVNAASKVSRVDIDISDRAGLVCVRLTGFATRAVEVDLGQTSVPEFREAPVLSPAAPFPNTVNTSAAKEGTLSERIEKLVASEVSKFLGTSGGHLDHQAEFSTYGFDSVSLTALTNVFNRRFGVPLDPTLFFEYPTIHQFAVHLAEVYGDRFSASAPPDRSEDRPNTAAPARDGVAVSTTSRSATASPLHDRESSRVSPEPIAIVGVSGRFPMAEDVDAFWRNLEGGRDCISEVPASRWDWKAIYGDPRTEVNKTNIKWGGFIEGVDEFDPLFFGISPKEAELMDPQQRLLMMFVWNAIEDAGYSAQRLSGTNTGIFVATGASGYGAILAKANVPIEAYTSTGMVPSVGPNRMSYYLNFHGPSEPIETACSSSLVAIHRAVMAIRTGSCDMAIAGGVSTILTPDLHISFSKAGMLCEDGRCKTFSDKANGYVRGEGVGMLFLKRLRDAERDGDAIYGVIAGSAENHGGRTNSLTAPNPKAQADVIGGALRSAGLDPSTISYIEAHGTGTGLGDPIEIKGLKQAFGAAKAAWCGVGSVKTNIGHLELAAGVSGAIKVLLQMKHGRLAKSLHCETLNPYIQLDGSPFYLVRETMEWTPLQDADGRELPRRAGVSSFGFGGVNAHVVLEEYRVLRGPVADRAGERVIVLSARNVDQLNDRVRQLYDFVRNPDQRPGLRLDDLAFTLQLGRDEMDVRLALVVSDLDDLEGTLARVLARDATIESVFQGKVEKSSAVLSLLTQDAEVSAAVSGLLPRGKLRELSELWVKGLPVDWAALYREVQPRRLHLPSYPFARQRCWVRPVKTSSAPADGKAGRAAIHPFVHQNISTVREQRYRSTFSGEEPLLADHVLRGVRILPGVAYLEMVRAALEDATFNAAIGSSWQRIRLRHLAWMSPFVVDDIPRRVDVVLTPDADGAIAFRVVTETEERDTQVHFQGLATEVDSVDALAIDLDAARNQCRESSVSAEELYALTERHGFLYGPSYRRLERVYRGADQVVASIRLPESTAESVATYILHPGVLDAALQASMALVHDLTSSTPRPALPYFAEHVDVLGPCQGTMWCVVRRRPLRSPDSRNIRTCDIDICNETGALAARIDGLSFVLLDDDTYLSTGADAQTAVLAACWKETPHEERPQTTYRSRAVVLAGFAAAFVGDVERRCGSAAAVSGISSSLSLEDAVVRIFTEIRRLSAASGNAGNVLFQVVTASSSEHGRQRAAACAGMLRSIRREDPRVTAQVIEWTGTADSLVTMLELDGRHGEDSRIRYADSCRWTPEWREIAGAPEPKVPWKDGGVYLITGGAGGLGRIFAREISSKVKGPHLILCGRGQGSDTFEAERLAGEALGASIEYRRLDVTDAAAVALLVIEIRSRYGALDGVLHAAGVLRDNTVSSKSEQEIREVLAPKVGGLVALDEATKDLPLDFFILFSSIAAVTGNAGQADYAAANGFMDVYADSRNVLVGNGLRSGRTLSVNWPLWEQGGMRMSVEMRRVMKQTTGLVPMPTAAGLSALYVAWAAGQSQVLVVCGRLGQVRRSLLERARPALAVTRSAGSDAGGSAPGVLDRVRQMLVETVAGIAKLDVSQIDRDAELTQYGFDSIALIQLSDTLNKSWGLSLTPAVFFEHPSVERLAGYLVDRYRVECEALGVSPTPAAAPPKPPAKSVAAGPVGASRFRMETPPRQHSADPSADDRIAIVGMAGRFPMADDIGQFWDNLNGGCDCITEIPPNRWDWHEYYGDPRKDGNKTNVKWGGFIDGVDEFDPLFFGISPTEAELMDPNQRLLMQYVWKAIEDAGYSPQSLSGTRTAILVGIGTSGYHTLASAGSMPIESFTSTGMAPCLGPNRASFFLNFRGPSEPIETACSSSLIALHRARVLLQSKSCDMAVVGGVNTIVTPLLHISFSKAGMLCEDGRCKTFSDKANGYARGEGVGMLMLKRLRDAERDGDHVYAVILGSAENHGGHAASMTAPNPRAQAEVISEAYASARVDPQTVSYLEAHGTGTSLGDPVEINALKMVFQNAPAGASCGVGTVKSNIGHLELAAGVAGVVKVLLQMRHRRLVKSLHCDTVSPYVQLDGSPFYILQEARDWEPLKDATGRALPRRAGVSSFGFGGVNAHVLLEEYVPPAAASAEQDTGRTPHAIVLSAKSRESLDSAVRHLAEFLKSNAGTSLRDLAFTLQIGRDAMDERLGLIADSVEDLRRTLDSIAGGNGGAASTVHRGTVRRRQDSFADVRSQAETWLTQKVYGPLLEQWVQGLAVDWSNLYAGQRPRRLSLPTYAFARERYWIDTYGRSTSSAAAPLPRLHPLVHEDISTPQQAAFRSTFTGEEFFLQDHLVKGRRVAPGVVHLEMARAAAVLAARDPFRKDTVRLRNIVWTQPLVVEGAPGRFETRLTPGDGGTHFEIRSDTAVYSQGWISFSAPAAPLSWDIAALKNACAAERFSAAECYGMLANSGLVIHAGHQAIEEALVGDREVLARLSLPAGLVASARDYVLHPSMLDSALQTISGLLRSARDVNRALDIQPGLPFAVEEVEVYAPCERTMWTLLRLSEGGAIQRFDVDLMDERGRCCVRFRGLSIRGMTGTTAAFPATRAAAVPAQAEPDEVTLTRQSLEYVKGILSGVIKLPAERIDVDAPLEKYGIDSLMAVRLTGQLEEVFGSLSKTIFFEYQTIRELTGFLAREHRARLLEVTGGADVRSESPTEDGTLEPVAGKARPEPTRGELDGHLNIAIVGLAGRYPGADTLDEFWRNLKDGRNSIGEVPADRWDHSLYYDENTRRPGTTYGKWGGFLNGVDEFDPLFFNITPRDAEYLEPQERLFLQCAWETIEDAGYTRQSLAECRDSAGLPGNVGVFVGVTYEEYQLYGAQETALGRPIALSGLPSSIANRVSYFFNFHGPSLSLDTMCSSSLTTIHLACESLRRGECAAAIAGGVNVSIHPNKYLMLGHGRFLSSKGQCESFGDGGDGYVPSEGVGAVLLKRLDQAVADGDHIYGVIRGTAINHGGKTNGYTVPNPNAQAAVIQRALEDMNVHPRTISYLEAHGTGTALGDPIEIAALNKVFRKYTRDTQFCAIGSVKSNIGHCESAAGIAGLTKVLLQMQYGALVPSLHSRLNEAIDFKASPFVLQNRFDRWPRPVIDLGGARMEYPRLAGISSFGAGGSNAHLIVEEHIAPIEAPSDTANRPEHWFLLSARNADRLRIAAQRLHDFLGEALHADRRPSLASIAFTLQVGRESMDERLAMPVRSIEDAIEQLRRFVEGEPSIPGLVHGDAKARNDGTRIGTGEDLQSAVEQALSGDRHDTLATLWVRGAAVDWSRCYQEVRPRKLSLPTYPFEKDKYWVPDTAGRSTSDRAGRARRLHPLLHENTSTFSEQRFSSTFRGDERFLSDHRVNDQALLPAVASLEMARAGVLWSAGVAPDTAQVVLRNVVWSRPVVVAGAPVTVHLGLSADADGRIAYEVYGASEVPGDAPIVYSRGTAVLRSVTEAPRLDLPAVRERCRAGLYEAQECYELFRSLGIDYGPAHRGIERVRLGRAEALARLRLPASVESPDDGYLLHPSMLDSALQVTLFAEEKALSDLKPSLPFALEELEVFGASTREMWAHVRPSAAQPASANVRKLDVDVCDDDGRVVVRFRGLSSRQLPREVQRTAEAAASVTAKSDEGAGTWMLTPVWEALLESDQRIELFPAADAAVAVVGGSEALCAAVLRVYPNSRRLVVSAEDTIEQVGARIRAWGVIDHIVWILPWALVPGPDAETIVAAQHEGVMLGFRLIKAMLREGFGARALGWTIATTEAQQVHRSDEVDPSHASVHGLAGSLAKEYPAWRIRLLDMPAEGEWPVVRMFETPVDDQGNSLAYRDGEWYRQQLIQFAY